MVSSCARRRSRPHGRLPVGATSGHLPAGGYKLVTNCTCMVILSCVQVDTNFGMLRSSLVSGASDGETSTGRHGDGGAGPSAGSGSEDGRRPALRAGRAAAGAIGCHAGANGGGAWRWARHGGAISIALARSRGPAFSCATAVGRPAASGNDPGGGAPLPRALGQAIGRGRHACRIPAARRTGPTSRASGGLLGGVSATGSARLAQSGPRHPTSQERSRGAAGVEKNSPARWQPWASAGK